MLLGVGDITLKSQKKILPLCTSFFTLNQEIDSWNYEYLSSSKKMLVPSIQNYQSKSKKWTISLSTPMLTPQDRINIYGNNYSRTFKVYSKVISNPIEISNITLDLNAKISIYNNDKNIRLNEVATPTNNNTYSIISNKIKFFAGFKDTITLYYYADDSTLYDTYDVSNTIYSFLGIIYTSSKQKILLDAKKIQIAKYPDFTVEEPQMLLNILENINLYKL